MKANSMSLGATVLAISAFCFSAAVSAVPLFCKEASAHHTPMDAAEVGSCLAADLGDLDDAISVDAPRNEISIAADPIGGDKLDNWFVYFLNPLLSSGEWRFAKQIDRDGRLTHIKLYGQSPSRNVPEPGALALLGIGLVAAGILGRRRQALI